LLSLFLVGSVVRGMLTILVAHVMFTLGYVVLTVRARLEGLDLHIEEAAMDLGANQWTTLRRVTLPLIAPGIAAAALLAFAISLDDFVITNFTAGQTVTFPLFVYGAARQGVPPQVNVVATGLLALVIILLFVNLAWQRRAARRDVGSPVVAVGEAS
jgi:spermidine/putrescine transport system permease protein